MNDCMEYRFKRVVVKVGSNVLTRADGSLDIARMVEIVSQIAALRDAGIEVLLADGSLHCRVEAVRRDKNDIEEEK